MLETKFYYFGGFREGYFRSSLSDVYTLEWKNDGDQKVPSVNTESTVDWTLKESTLIWKKINTTEKSQETKKSRYKSKFIHRYDRGNHAYTDGIPKQCMYLVVFEMGNR